MNAGIERALQKMNIIYDTFVISLRTGEKDDAFCEQFEAKIKKTGGRIGRYFPSTMHR